MYDPRPPVAVGIGRGLFWADATPIEWVWVVVSVVAAATRRRLAVCERVMIYK